MGFKKTISWFIGMTLAMAACFFHSPPAEANVLASDDFESSLTQWRISGSSTIDLVSWESRTGARSVRMVAKPDNPVPYRTEVELRDGRGDFHAGRDYCIRFSMKVKNWSTFPDWATLLQTHAVPNNHNWSCKAGRNSITLFTDSAQRLKLAVVNDNSRITSDGAIATTVESTALQMDSWYDYKIRYRPSFSSDGIIQVYRNGRLVYSFAGGNMDPRDRCGRPSEPYTYLKLGIYKDKSDTGTQRAFYDTFSITENDSTCR